MPNSTMVAAPIRVESLDEALDRAARARDAGADLVEWRVDSLEGLGVEDGRRWVRRLCEDAGGGLPCIVTCRAAEEGGDFEGSDEHRLALYEAALGFGADGRLTGSPARYIDVEHGTLERSPELRRKLLARLAEQRRGTDRPTSLILSFHDTGLREGGGRPPDLLRKLSAMRAMEEAAVLKIAITARSLRDNLEVFDILAEADRPMIALAMGQFGLMSRVLAGKFGALLTFASLGKESTTAPGQPTIRELLDLYRFRSIGRDTRVYGVVGWPVEHSISPHVHNAGFEAVGHDGVYLPMPVAAHESDDEATYASFKATAEAMLDSRIDLGGLSVTIPFKEHLFRWCHSLPLRPIAAANTLSVVRKEANETPPRIGEAWDVANTDLSAIESLLEERLGEFSGKRIAVLGAGGVARAAAWACVSRRADVVVHNRSAGRAEALVAALTPHLEPGKGTLSARDIADLATDCDAYINCTPLGMSGGPAPDESPIPPETLVLLQGGAIIFDTVYTPRATPLLKAAREAGLPTIDGLAMFVRQAAAQFEIWTGKSAPLKLVETVAEETLAERERRQD